MKNIIHVVKMKQSHTHVRFVIKAVILLALYATASSASQAQCTGCTQTVSTNSAAITVNSGQVVCLTYSGTFSQSITFNGGTLCISPATTVSASITVNSGCTLNVYGKVTGAYTTNGGSTNVYSGGNFTPSSATFNGGTFTNNSGGTVSVGTISVSSSVTLLNNGTFTASSLTDNGASITLVGTSSITGSLTVNSGTFIMAGPATIGGSYTANGGTSTFSGGINVGGSVTNNATINLSGSFTVGGTYNSNSGASINADAAGNNSLTASSVTGYGSLNGGGYTLAISPMPSCTSCMTNGAYAVATPTQQPTGLLIPISGSTVNGSFTSPSASISGYIVLRYVGTSAPSDNPTNNTSYSVGSTIGSSTVVAVISSSSTGTRTFTDNIPSGSCGKNMYYRIFSYSGSGSAILYDRTSPLTGSVAVSNPTAAITPSGATTFCSPGSVTLTASGGTSYVWSTGATSAAITASTSATYTMTVTNANGCTATASQVVTVNTVSAITPYMIANGNGWQNISTASVCAGSYVEFGPQPASGTWTWTGPSSFTSRQRDTAISTIASAQSGTYVATYTDANGCSATQNFTVTVNSASASVNSPTVCAGTSATLTASGGGTYAWSTGATGPSISTSVAGSYTVTVTAANTCSATATGTVTLTAPSASIVVTGACPGGSSTLTASGGNSYVWSTGATTASISSTTATSYTVTVTGAASCTATATASAIIYTNPSLSTTSNTPVCVGSTATITATPSGSTSYTYSWSGPSSFTASSSAISVANATTSNSGNYNITVTDNHNCSVSAAVAMYVNPNCDDSTTVGANGGNSSDAPCTQILRFDHYNDAVASQAGGQNHTWVLNNGNVLNMTITRTAGGFTAVTAPTWSGAAFGQSGYSGLSGKTVLYTSGAGYSKLVFSNISMKDSNGHPITNFTLIGIDGESTDNSERDTLTSNGTSWFDYDTITPPNVGSVPSESGIGTSTLVWTGTGPANARARLVSTNNPTYFTFSTVAGGLQGFAMGVSNPIQAITATTICSGGSFNATPTNLPSGTTYTWSAPTVTPAGSLTGATATTSPVAVVGQTLVNTTTAAATAVYNVIPSNNCSGLGYTVTVTVNPAPSATITSNSPQCTGNTLTATATPVSGGTLTYSWSGPNSVTSTTSSISVSNAAVSATGTYTVTITGSNTCTATVSSSLSVVNCLTVSGNIFDDANGDGTMNGTESKTDYGQTVYAVIADTNGVVISTSAIASNGAFTLSNVLPSKSGMTVRISTTAPAAGSSVPAASWPANWLGTLGSYGTNNAAGTGVYSNASELIPVRTTTVNVTNMMIGFDRLQAPVAQTYTISHPALNSILALDAAAGLGNITWADPEDGSNVGSFVVKSVAGMNGNILFYDSNNNNIADASEIITGYRAISNFNDQRLKVKFVATGTSSITFTFGYIDAAGKTNPAASSYTVTWTGGALPVQLEYFTAQKQDAHSALLQWATASEINDDHFEIERSADAQTWTTLGEVKGAGTTDLQQLYSYTDESPMNGVNYYRLKQVDVDGHYVYTNIQDVSFDGLATTDKMTMYPNPSTASTPLTIELSNPASIISNVTITNSIGQVVFSDISSQSGVLHLSDLHLPAGVYAVSVFTGGASALSSLLVIK